MLHRMQGIIIRQIDYGEGNKILTVFTKEAGKVSVMAKGVKKVNSRHSAASQLFTYGDYVFFKKGQMGTLNNGEVINSYKKLREELHCSAYASYIAELTYRLTDDKETYPHIFEQMVAGFDALADGKDGQIIAHIYELKMLGLSGYSPVLSHCVSCNKTIREPIYFGPVVGGTLCSNCKNTDAFSVFICPATLKILQLFQQFDLKKTGRISLKPDTKNQLKQCIRAFMDAHLETEWKSRRFLDQMDKYQL